MDQHVPAVLLSGGSEIVTVGIAEALLPLNIPLIVISLGKPTILRDSHPLITDYQIEWPAEDAADQIVACLQPHVKSHPLPLFATEDSSLRLISEHRAALIPYAAIPSGCAEMTYSGLDKAEFYRFVNEHRIPYCVPTAVLHSPDEIESLFDQFGEQVVIKPALKPFSMDLSGLGGKAKIIQRDEYNRALVDELTAVWPISAEWVAQPLMKNAPMGEASFCGVCDASGDIVGLTVFERWKHPRFGGTACWVSVHPAPKLEQKAREILRQLNFQGIVEMSFLLDEDGEWQMIELNPRAWLQVSLPTRAGVNLPALLYKSLMPTTMSVPVEQKTADWVNVERLLIAAFSGGYGTLPQALGQALRVIRHSQCRVMYDSFIPNVRRRWIQRVMQKTVGI